MEKENLNKAAMIKLMNQVLRNLSSPAFQNLECEFLNEIVNEDLRLSTNTCESNYYVMDNILRK